MHPLPENGMIHLRSRYPVAETLQRLEKLLEARGIAVMARIDHGAGATAVGLTMQPAVLLIFGNPKSGTPLMVAAPTVALDLPLKALVWQDGDDAIWLSYNSPKYLQERHHVPSELLGNISGVVGIFQKAVED